ncbi:MAG: hypothetical protein ACREGD_02335 [Candidatus Saccharimonadales bacterium]
MDAKKTTKTKQLPDAFALFKPSWKAFQLNFETFVWQLLLPVGIAGLAVLGFVVAGFAFHASGSENIIPFIAAGLLALVALYFVVVIAASLIVTELHSARMQEISFMSALRDIQGSVLKLVGLFIIFSLAVGIGLILFILPGLFAFQRLLLAPYYLVDQKLGVFESIRRSWRAGSQYSGAVWGIVGIVVAINLVSWVPLVGWLASLILTVMYFCAPAIRYRQIVEHAGTKPPNPLPAVKA